MTPAMSRGIRRRQQKDFEATLRDLGCSPIEILVAIAMNRVPCAVCQHMDIGSDCKRCGGSKFEPVDVAIRANVAGKMLDKLVPDLRSIDHTSSDDSHIEGIKVVFVDAGQRVPGGGAPALLMGPKVEE